MIIIGVIKVKKVLFVVISLFVSFLYINVDAADSFSEEKSTVKYTIANNNCFSCENRPMYGSINIYGRLSSGDNWYKSSYGEYGYFTIMKVSDTAYTVQDFAASNFYDDVVYLNYDNNHSLTNTSNGVSLTLTGGFAINDEYIQLTYIATNTSSTSKYLSFGTHNDIQISQNDAAAVTLLPNNIGFQMIDDEANNIQLNVLLKSFVGVTDVSTFWIGQYDDEVVNVFNDQEEAISGHDSSMAYSWKNQLLTAGQSQTYTVLLTVGEALTNPIITLATNNKEKVYEAGTNTDGTVYPTLENYVLKGNVFDALLTDDVTVYYKLNGGTAVSLGSYEPNNSEFSITIPEASLLGINTIEIYGVGSGNRTSVSRTFTFKVMEWKEIVNTDLGFTINGYAVKGSSIEISKVTDNAVNKAIGFKDAVNYLVEIKYSGNTLQNDENLSYLIKVPAEIDKNNSNLKVYSVNNSYVHTLLTHQITDDNISFLSSGIGYFSINYGEELPIEIPATGVNIYTSIIVFVTLIGFGSYLYVKKNKYN